MKLGGRVAWWRSGRLGSTLRRSRAQRSSTSLWPKKYVTLAPAKRKAKNRSTEHKIARRSVPTPSSEYHSAARTNKSGPSARGGLRATYGPEQTTAQTGQTRTAPGPTRAGAPAARRQATAHRCGRRCRPKTHARAFQHPCARRRRPFGASPPCAEARPPRSSSRQRAIARRAPPRRSTHTARPHTPAEHQFHRPRPTQVVKSTKASRSIDKKPPQPNTTRRRCPP